MPLPSQIYPDINRTVQTSFSNGYNLSSGVRKDREEKERQNALAQALPGAFRGDEGALNSLAQANPQLAAELFQHNQTRQDKQFTANQTRQDEQNKTNKEEMSQAFIEAYVGVAGLPEEQRASGQMEAIGKLKQAYPGEFDQISEIYDPNKFKQLGYEIASKNPKLAELLTQVGILPQESKGDESYTLGPGARRYGANNELVAEGAPRAEQSQWTPPPRIVETPSGFYLIHSDGQVEQAQFDGEALASGKYDPNARHNIKRGEVTGKGSGEANVSLDAAKASYPQLESTVKDLKELGKNATYTMAGRARDFAMRELGMGATKSGVSREKYIQTVRDVLFPQLRQTFGAQFTVKEGEMLIATLGDPDKTSEEKNAALDAFIEQKKKTIESLERQTGRTSGPKVGTVENGYRFKGGNPADQSNWEQVQ